MRNALGTVDSVLLLGGRSEIGLAIVERLVRAGTRKVVLASRPEGADAGANPAAPNRREDAVARLRKLGADVLPLDFDATRPETHGPVIDAAVEFAGDLDVVIAAFGVLGDQARYEADPVAAAESITVNLAGHVSAGLFAARRLREQRHGTLIVLSSMAGVRVRRANFVYGAAKAGLDGFAQGLGDSLHDSGARVMIVRPGFVIGRMTAHLPTGPMPTTPDAVAKAVVEGLREGRRVVWAPPALRLASLALRALPQTVWRRLKR
ncbi:SDR family NAD(P)-dependent oxidoreductase [Thermopolyspora sp. NPDC052614]|uniref:SDR family NAD(P)-dependent oxidoreductase n=1 Tax=Thermopolyspora sp. NPDC052614 TaxID=3155682 RepID=UPI0034494BE8